MLEPGLAHLPGHVHHQPPAGCRTAGDGGGRGRTALPGRCRGFAGRAGGVGRAGHGGGTGTPCGRPVQKWCTAKPSPTSSTRQSATSVFGSIPQRTRSQTGIRSASASPQRSRAGRAGRSGLRVRRRDRGRGRFPGGRRGRGRIRRRGRGRRRRRDRVPGRRRRIRVRPVLPLRARGLVAFDALARSEPVLRPGLGPGLRRAPRTGRALRRFASLPALLAAPHGRPRRRDSLGPRHDRGIRFGAAPSACVLGTARVARVRCNGGSAWLREGGAVAVSGVPPAGRPVSGAGTGHGSGGVLLGGQQRPGAGRRIGPRGGWAHPAPRQPVRAPPGRTRAGSGPGAPGRPAPRRTPGATTGVRALGSGTRRVRLRRRFPPPLSCSPRGPASRRASGGAPSCSPGPPPSPAPSERSSPGSARRLPALPPSAGMSGGGVPHDVSRGSRSSSGSRGSRGSHGSPRAPAALLDGAGWGLLPLLVRSCPPTVGRLDRLR